MIFAGCFIHYKSLPHLLAKSIISTAPGWRKKVTITHFSIKETGPKRLSNLHRSQGGDSDTGASTGQGRQSLSLQRGARVGTIAGGSQGALQPDGPSEKPADPRASGQVSLRNSELFLLSLCSRQTCSIHSPPQQEGQLLSYFAPLTAYSLVYAFSSCRAPLLGFSLPPPTSSRALDK